MYLSTQINPSDCYRINRFDVLVVIAKGMKSCHIFIASPDGNMYGCPEEGFALYRCAIPPEYIPPVPIRFRLDTLDVNAIMEVKDYYYYPSIYWQLFIQPPEEVELMNIYTKFFPIDKLEGGWKAVSEQYGDKPIPGIIDLCSPNSIKSIPMPRLNNLINGWAEAQPYLGLPKYFNDLHLDEDVIEVATGKASIGRRFITLIDENGKKYGFHIFRNLINLNKNDTMDIAIRDRLDNPNLFVVDFFVTRKNTPYKTVLKDTYKEMPPFTVVATTPYLHVL